MKFAGADSACTPDVISRISKLLSNSIVCLQTRSEQKFKSHSREVLNNDKCCKRAPNKSQLHRGKTRRVSGPARQTSGLAERAQTEESQPVVLYADASYLFTDELFDKYPPPEHMEIDTVAFSELRAELLGQQIGGRLPNQGQLKRFQSIEQFLLYDAYASYW